MPRRLSTIEHEIVQHCREENPIHLRILLDKRDEALLSEAAQCASITSIEVLLKRLSSTVSRAAQIILENSALAGNVTVFRHMLRRPKDRDLGGHLCSYAVAGGVAIWEALLEFDPKCVDWSMGERGNALGLAVEKRNEDLVRFLLQRGANVEESNVMGVPVLTYARCSRQNPSRFAPAPVSQEIISLLERYWRQMDDDVD